VDSGFVKKTITLPRELVGRLKASTRNLSAFIAQACHEKLEADEKRAREQDMIERCRVRYQEDRDLAHDFFPAEQEAWEPR